MTIIKGERIKVVPDPFNISDKFNHDLCTSETLKIYKYYFFLEYFLIPVSKDSQKNSTFLSLSLQTTKDESNNHLNPAYENKVVSFRISKEELNKLNELLQTNFQASNQLIIRATKIPEFIKNKYEGINYTKGFLTLSDKPENATKSGILFKPFKNPYVIVDYEEDGEEDENKYLGKLLYSNKIKTKIIKKLACQANKSFNKTIYLYFYKENDLNENNIKSYFFLSNYPHYLNFGKYIQEEKNEEEYKYIHKIQTNSEVLTKILKNFSSDINNPDFISVWTKGLVIKTNFVLKLNYNEVENNNENNNENQNSQNENDQDEESKSYMQIKAFMFFDNIAENINFEGIDINDGKAKKNFIVNLIQNNVDENHNELNKSIELSDKEGVVWRGNNNLMDEEEDDDDDYKNNEDNINDISKDNDDEDNEIQEKKEKVNIKKKKVKEEINEDNDKNNSDDDNDNDKSHDNERKQYRKNKKQKNKK